jgi:hypothetical protein
MSLTMVLYYWDLESKLVFPRQNYSLLRVSKIIWVEHEEATYDSLNSLNCTTSGFRLD